MSERKDQPTSGGITTLATSTFAKVKSLLARNHTVRFGPHECRKACIEEIASALASVAQHDYKPAYELAQANADAALAECERLRAELAEARAWSELVTQGKSPCGHWKAYAVTEDGGKHIDCLQCEVERLRAELAQAQGYVEHLPDCPARHERPIHLPRSGGPVIDTAFGCSCGLDELLARLRDLPPVSTTGEKKK